MLVQLLVSGIAVGSVYTLVALGMTLLYRSTTIVNFCHGEFFMLGAFGVMVPLQILGWSYPAAIATSLVLLLLVGALTERILIRPLKNAPFVTLAMMTVALSYLLKGVSRFFYGREVVSLPPLLDGERLNVFQLTVQAPDGAQRSARLPPGALLQLVAATNFKQRMRKSVEHYHADRLQYAVAGTPNVLPFKSSGLAMLGLEIISQCDFNDSPTTYLIPAPLSAACAPPDGIGMKSMLPVS